MATYTEWEEAVTQAIADKHGITYSDAAGVVEGQPFYMQQSWGKGLDSAATACKISEAAGFPKSVGDQRQRVDYEVRIRKVAHYLTSVSLSGRF